MSGVVTLAAVEAALRKWVPASEALVEQVMAELGDTDG